MPYAPIVFISALTGQRISRLLPLVLEIEHERRKRVPTSELNELLRAAVMKQPPMATRKGAHLRIYYATQPQVAPPVFLFFANNHEMIHWSYGRYLENRIRERYGFGGTPIVIVFRSREREQKR
jgi:GTP-binding protein